MNDKINLPVLSQLLALQTGDTKKEAEDFIREFCALVSETLESGESLKIKDFGTFKTIDVEARKSVDISTGEGTNIPKHKKVVFVPSKELASIVNEPFEMFETIELADQETALTDDLDEAQEEANVYTIPENELILQEVREEKVLEKEEEDTRTQRIDPPVADQEDTKEFREEEEENEKVYHEEVIPEGKCKIRRHSFGIGMLTGFSIAVVAGALVWLAWVFLMPQSSRTGLPEILTVRNEGAVTVPESEEENKDSKQAVTVPKEASKSSVDEESISKRNEKKDVAPTQPSDTKVYDTITKTRYLTTMAKDHYGNYNLWPYIYEENKAFLGHPDRIKPGTQVVIPRLSKYGVDPENPADIAEAKRKGVAIYARYR